MDIGNAGNGVFTPISIRLCLLRLSPHPNLPKTNEKEEIWFQIFQIIKLLLYYSTSKHKKNVAGLNREAMAGCLADTSGSRSNHLNHSTQFFHPKKISPSLLVKIFLHILYIIGHEKISHAFIHRRLTWFYISTFWTFVLCMWPNE